MTYILDADTEIETTVLHGDQVEFSRIEKGVSDHSVASDLKKTGEHKSKVGNVTIHTRIVNPVRDISNAVFIVQRKDIRGRLGKPLEVKRVTELRNLLVYVAYWNDAVGNPNIDEQIDVLRSNHIVEFSFLTELVTITVK